MSDELNSQLSAFVDNELTPEESELFVRRLCRDEKLRYTAACYGIIGDVLRGEATVTAPGEFAAGVMMAVEGQTVPVAVTPPVQESNYSARNWGFAVAASVALAAIALVTLPDRDPGSPDTTIVETTVSAEQSQPAFARIDEPAPVSVAPAAINPRGSSSPHPAFTTVAVGGSARDYNVPIVMPATAENRAKLNNLLLQHLYSSGATRHTAGFRNVGFETQTESER